MPFTDEYADVLYSIEKQILAVYRRNPILTDYMVMRSLESAIEHFVAKDRGRPPRTGALREIETELFQRIVAACDMHLKRSDNGESERIMSLGVKEITQSLKKILKSVQFWEKQGGRQSYLEYISMMVP